MTEPLPFCTRCSTPRIAVYELADGTTRCTGCIAHAIRESERQWQVRDFLENLKSTRQADPNA